MKATSTSQLFQHVWKAADILRGSIDASDYKGFIFSLLFLKRASDVFDEEAERILKETGDEKLAYDEPDEHPIFVHRCVAGPGAMGGSGRAPRGGVW